MGRQAGGGGGDLREIPKDRSLLSLVFGQIAWGHSLERKCSLQLGLNTKSERRRSERTCSLQLVEHAHLSQPAWSLDTGE